MALPRSILLIISGSIAAYKSLELIRLLKERGVEVRAILTKGGAAFVTPLAVSSLTGTKTYHDLFSLTDEVEMGHIELSRSAEHILIAPASADILAKMTHGIADDLATTALLATDAPVSVAPAMNHRMWSHPATRRNIATLRADGIGIIGPVEGAMACGEFGVGRMAEPQEILAALEQDASAARRSDLTIPAFLGIAQTLKGKHAIVTSGPTYEPVDPVRFLGNHASGKQGHAVAAALAAAGADVTLISGPTALGPPPGVRTISVTTAAEMYAAVMTALPADIFVGAAAVADWRMTHVSPHKIKKHGNHSKLTLDLIPTEDIIAAVSNHKPRPALVVGFAAETNRLAEHAKSKRKSKHCDMVLANNVADGKVFGAEDNTILFLSEAGEASWPTMSKHAVAEKLVDEISNFFNNSAIKKTRA
ncbi:MAG: bifunctional phosphopantothenoylcysteine decarboxylase/phosphopantothenate--cysteine ligase CoaBC [Rickettsiales bacterium]|nr:bifunctional phosphopantothenoylcysteine decarboxylase/phosphopantothenate--cysteine ligase CoaBC [Rickettsiales bacterium]